MKRVKQKPGSGKPARAQRRASATTQAVLGTARAGWPLIKEVPSKWAWHYRALLQSRERLLKAQRGQLQEAAEPMERHSMDMADSASDEFDHDLALSELSTDQNALYEVEEALKRIASGSYGVCEETGEPIPAARLRAIPWARFSKVVEERLEKKGIIRRPHLGKVSSVFGSQPESWASAEETEETEALSENGEAKGKPTTKPNDEALGRTFIPPGRHVQRPRRKP